MLHVGTRSEPSIKNLLIIVVLVVAATFYLILSFSTGDWQWWNPRFDQTPSAIVVHCYGESISIEPGSLHFSALTKVVNQSISGQKRWDSLTMSAATYQDYQNHPQMAALELFYPETVRIHSNYKFYSNVDNIVIPLDGRHAQTNAIFGQNQGLTTAGSMHIETKEPITSYLENHKICPNSVGGN